MCKKNLKPILKLPVELVCVNNHFILCVCVNNHLNAPARVCVGTSTKAINYVKRKADKSLLHNNNWEGHEYKEQEYQKGVMERCSTLWVIGGSNTDPARNDAVAVLTSPRGVFLRDYLLKSMDKRYFRKIQTNLITQSEAVSLSGLLVRLSGNF